MSHYFIGFDCCIPDGSVTGFLLLGFWFVKRTVFRMRDRAGRDSSRADLTIEKHVIRNQAGENFTVKARWIKRHN